MKNYKNINNKLSKLLSFFINRPNHLARYLLDSNALTSEFIEKISNVDLPDSEKQKIHEVYFVDINQMNTFFRNLLNKEKYPDTDPENLYLELTSELEKCILEERYEDAIRIRDYLKSIKNKIKP